MSVRPSSLPALQACPCFTADQTTGEDDKAAGTLRHDALFRYLGGDVSALEDLDEVDRAGVEWAGEYIRTHAPTSEYPLERETKGAFLGPDFLEVRGTPDVVCGPVLFDLKWRDDVSDYGPQMAAYSLMIGHDPVKVHILYALHKRAEVLEFSVESAEGVVFPIIDRANAPDKKPSACSYCGWCANRLTCPAVIEQVQKAQVGKPAETIDTADAMGDALRTARVVKDWCEAVEAAAKDMAFKKGVLPTGFAPVTRAGNREIPDINQAFGLTGLPQGDFLAACKISFTKLVEAFAGFHGMKKAPAERDLETKLGDAMRRTPSISYLRAAKE